MRYMFVLAFCTSLCAQEIGDLATERPGFTATTGMVGFGVLQLEQGYTFQSARDEGSKLESFSGPQALVRFGVLDALELRFSTDGYAWETDQLAGTRTALDGANDYNVGAKVRLLKQHVLQPEVSLIGAVSLPAKGSPFTSSGHDPSFILGAYKDLPGKFSVATNLNMASITDEKGRFFSTAESVWIARSLAGGFSVYGEAFRTTIDRQDGSETAIDGGVFRLIGRHIQVDAEAGRTMAGSRPSWFASVGCVVRAPRALLGPGWYRFSR